METVTFEEVQNHRAKALQAFEEQRRRILSWAPSAEVMHVGSTSFDEGLSRGDLDVQIRVSAADYAAALAAIAPHYVINEDGYTSDDAASFKDDDLDPPVGIIITVIDGSGDVLWRFRDALRANPDLAAEYSKLKAGFQNGSLQDYRAAKHLFVRRVIRTREYAELAQSQNWRFRAVRLETENLLVCNVQDGDATRFANYYARNREHLAPWEPPRSAKWTTKSFWEERITEHLGLAHQGRSMQFLWLPKDDPGAEIVGVAGLADIVAGAFLACHLGFSVDRENEGCGYAREALEAVIRFAFEEIGLHRVMVNYTPTNQRCARLLRRLGFVIDGSARIGGRWHDHVLGSLTNPSDVRPAPSP